VFDSWVFFLSITLSNLTEIIILGCHLFYRPKPTDRPTAFFFSRFRSESTLLSVQSEFFQVKFFRSFNKKTWLLTLANISMNLSRCSLCFRSFPQINQTWLDKKLNKCLDLMRKQGKKAGFGDEMFDAKWHPLLVRHLCASVNSRQMFESWAQKCWILEQMKM
jgi:hypothetical protein